jgi:hypothetical protein
MAVRGSTNTIVTYNSVAITAYVNSVELAATIDELEATDMASTVSEYSPSLASYTLSLGGDWIKALDDALGPDTITPTVRTCVVKFTDENGAWVQYSWATAFISAFSISSTATGKIEHSPSIRLSGTPTRTTGTS